MQQFAECLQQLASACYTWLSAWNSWPSAYNSWQEEGGGRLLRSIIHVSQLIELYLVPQTRFKYGLDNLSYKV
jgi:hypothetical protein